MALGEETSGGIGATMLVSPTGNISTGYPALYPVQSCGGQSSGGMGFGGDWSSLIVLFLLFGMFSGGFGGNGVGGCFGGGGDFPWLINGQQGINNNVSSGFRDAQITDGITSVRDGVTVWVDTPTDILADTAAMKQRTD